jgi:hypothetical protein
MLCLLAACGGQAAGRGLSASTSNQQGEYSQHDCLTYMQDAYSVLGLHLHTLYGTGLSASTSNHQGELAHE